MFWFKRCPRCSGDLFEDRDQYGPFVTCMQCGLNKDIPDEFAGPLDISLEPVPAPVIPRVESGKRRRMSHGGRHTYRTYANHEVSTAVG